MCADYSGPRQGCLHVYLDINTHSLDPIRPASRKCHRSFWRTSSAIFSRTWPCWPWKEFGDDHLFHPWRFRYGFWHGSGCSPSSTVGFVDALFTNDRSTRQEVRSRNGSSMMLYLPDDDAYVIQEGIHQLRQIMGRNVAAIPTAIPSVNPLANRFGTRFGRTIGSSWESS